MKPYFVVHVTLHGDVNGSKTIPCSDLHDAEQVEEALGIFTDRTCEIRLAIPTKTNTIFVPANVIPDVREILNTTSGRSNFRKTA